MERSKLRSNKGFSPIFVALLNAKARFIRKLRDNLSIPQKQLQMLTTRYEVCGKAVESCGKAVESIGVDVESVWKLWGKILSKIRNAKK
ncbi:MAG: hypothetical protein WBA57_24965 [Elainellaceae cyanobacterium]